MSSSMNNNLPIQNLTTSSCSAEFTNPRQGSSSAGNAIRSQREQTISSHRGQTARTGRGRAKKSGFPNRSDNNANRAVGMNPQDTTDAENSAENSPGQVNVSNVSVGRVIGYKTSGTRGGSGKYRQRQHTNQLIDGMNPLTNLDIELVEGSAPSGSSGGVAETGNGRHAANNRKVNLTHLLNYKFERKQRGGRYQPSSSFSDSNTGSYRRNVSSHYRDPGTLHKFSKQQFLQANCQFVVLDGHDYTVHKADPDWPVDWDCIEEVRFKQIASTETTCPICLEPPVAAKITRCGHIYCWTCMLHYLSLSDENCRQCPICFEPVYKSDLRSVVSHTFINHSVEEEIVMKLMVRKKGCVEVEPYKVESFESQGEAVNQSSNVDNDHYWSQANLVIVDSLTVITKIAQRERNELLTKLELDKNEPEVCFIEQAINWLEKRMEKLRHRTTDDLKLKTQEYRNQERLASPLTCTESSKSYLFYQCSDGQHIYLNPFSTKILCHEFDNLENCPLEIRAKILQMDWISMSEAWRKRFRYLEHLPLTCEYRLIEIDFEKSNLISQKTYRVFEDQIKRREQERERRRREERKREKIIQVEQNRKIYGIQPSLKINLNNIDQFPSVSDERYLGLSLPRNQTSTYDNLSSDDEEFIGAHISSNDSNPPQLGPGANIADSDASSDTMSGVALSFKDIQLQEAAMASQKSAKENSKPASVWANKKQGSTSTQSSFAQLLVNAKTSQKEWTRNISSVPGAANILPGPSHRTNPVSGSEDGDEVLRAPPCEFTISDFIDMNVVSNAGKKKGKPKNACKKS